MFDGLPLDLIQIFSGGGWFLVGNLLAGNILGAIHGGAHTLCQNKSNHPRISHLILHYWWMHLAHHIVEDVPGVTEADRRPFLRTPFTGWLFIAGGMALVATITTVPTSLALAAVSGTDGLLLRPLLCWAGLFTFFLQYEVMHRRTHQRRQWFVSRMHAAHHTDWARNFGITWYYDLLARYGMRWVHRFIAGLRVAEDATTWLPGVGAGWETLVNNGRKRYKWALEVKRRYRANVEALSAVEGLVPARPEQATSD
jgi:hypothetical protein